MMREVFEAFLTDPIRVNEDVFALWLEGHNASDALVARLRLPSAVPMPFLGGDAAAKHRELLWRDTVDQYRLYDKLEHYLSQPSLFRSQLLFQIPPAQQYYMVERYYSRDADVDRWLLGKKLSGRLEKDLDDVAEHSGRTLKSCRRQLENLRRVYAAVEDRNFHGLPCRAVNELFLLSEQLASKYACLLFILHTRFQVHPHHPSTGFLTWNDLRFFAALLMTHWLPQRKRQSKLILAKGATTSIQTKGNVVENGAQIALRSSSKGEWPAIGFLQEHLKPTSVYETVGLDLSHPLTSCLRDLKAHLINDNDVLKVYRENIMTRPKELQHLLEHLLTRVVRVLHDCKIQKSQFNALFSALIDALTELDVWYLNGQETRGFLLASWDLFISVCRVIVLTVYDRSYPSVASAYEYAISGHLSTEAAVTATSAYAANRMAYDSSE
ncbi:hypothetical protein G195_005561 [Phytophthora kernoviae 00238/432]|uniref:Acidic fibroblast growth factor intracellular-binding protein n=1 Tax=Phytophthora kernoviae 00238/432 TaxID=1284355 RepID=A0A8J4W5G7_9STRA|nr:hypothetical protein G195_005561 [Phytophthora kernoviae 00238/432]